MMRFTLLKLWKFEHVDAYSHLMNTGDFGTQKRCSGHFCRTIKVEYHDLLAPAAHGCQTQTDTEFLYYKYVGRRVDEQVLFHRFGTILRQ